jgi:hypothetical protein
MFRIVFWDVLPCKMIVNWRFRGAYCLHHQSTIILHGSTSQKTILNIILAAVRTWNLTNYLDFHVETVCRGIKLVKISLRKAVVPQLSQILLAAVFSADMSCIGSADSRQDRRDWYYITLHNNLNLSSYFHSLYFKLTHFTLLQPCDKTVNMFTLFSKNSVYSILAWRVSRLNTRYF